MVKSSNLGLYNKVFEELSFSRIYINKFIFQWDETLSDCRSLPCVAVNASQNFSSSMKTSARTFVVWTSNANEQDSHLLTRNVCICNCTWIHVSCAQARLIFFMFIILHPPYEPAPPIYIVLLQNLVSFEGTPSRTNPKTLTSKIRTSTHSFCYLHMYFVNM